MPNEFNIKEMHVVLLQTEEDLFRIGFCDNPSRPNNYLIMERLKEYSIQDKEMGMDSFYIEVNGQQNCQHGGIDGIEFTDSEFVFYFAFDSKLYNYFRILRFATDPCMAIEAIEFIERHFHISVDCK